MSEKYDYQSYLYPASSASSGGGASAGAGSGTGAALTKAAVQGALGSTTLERVQALLPHFEAGFIEKPDGLADYTWWAVKFKEPYTGDLDKLVVLVMPLLDSYAYFLVQNVTAEGFEFQCTRAAYLRGMYYTKFATA